MMAQEVFLGWEKSDMRVFVLAFTSFGERNDGGGIWKGAGVLLIRTFFLLSYTNYYYWSAFFPTQLLLFFFLYFINRVNESE